MANLPQKPFSRMPLFAAAICFSSGIAAGKFSSIGWELWLGAGIVAAAAALAYRRIDAGTLLIGIAFFAAGAFAYQAELSSIRADRIRSIYDRGLIPTGSPVEVEGVLTESPEPSVDGVFLTLRADSLTYRGVNTRVSGRIRVFVPQKPDDENLSNAGLGYGSRVRLACLLKREDEFLNPGVMQRREMLDRMGIDAIATVKSPLLIEHIADESVFLPVAWVYDRRAAVIDLLRRELEPDSSGLMIAALLGNKFFLDKETAELFREGGTFHVLVISGLHITFIGGVMLLIVRSFTKNRWVQFAVTSVALWAYAVAVGADVPVVRAAFMFTFLLLGYAFYRNSSTFNSLGLCAFVLLAFAPSQLFDASFQLTFVSILAIVGLAFPVIEKCRAIGKWTPSAAQPFPPAVSSALKRFCEAIYWKPETWPVTQRGQIWSANLEKAEVQTGYFRAVPKGILKYLFEGVIVSLAVQVAILPLSVIYFHRISFASILLNLWVGALVAVQGVFVVAGSILYGVSGFLASVLFTVSETVNRLLMALPNAAISTGSASIRLPAYEESGRVVYAVYLLLIVALMVAANMWSPFSHGNGRSKLRLVLFRSAAALIVIFTAIIVFHPFSTSDTKGRLTVHFLDVGQGDAIFVVFPDGKTLLVDGGGRPDYRSREEGDDDESRFEPDRRTIGEAVVSETLWAMGYSRVDHLLPTHGDADHIQGLTDVARSFGVTSALVARFPEDDADLIKFTDVLRRRNIDIQAISAGDTIEIGGARIEVLYPQAGDGRNQRFDNDHSVVLRIDYGERSFLLTGDIEERAETALVNGGYDLQTDVVKVPHHGSRTSSTREFVLATNARIAVIPVGRRSPYGHPHAEVVDRWRSMGTEVITTGERGMVTISTDGKGLWVETFR